MCCCEDAEKLSQTQQRGNEVGIREKWAWSNRGMKMSEACALGTIWIAACWCARKAPVRRNESGTFYNFSERVQCKAFLIYGQSLNCNIKLKFNAEQEAKKSSIEKSRRLWRRLELSWVRRLETLAGKMFLICFPFPYQLAAWKWENLLGVICFYRLAKFTDINECFDSDGEENRLQLFIWPRKAHALMIKT